MNNKEKNIKKIMKELVELSVSLGLTSLVAELSFVTAFNGELDGALDGELSMVNELYQKKIREQREIKRQLEQQGTGVFSVTQIDHSGIMRDKRLWLEMMYAMTNADNRVSCRREINDEDLCAAFLAVLRANNEFVDKGSYSRFFGMMSELMKISMTEKERKRIVRYIQDNSANYLEWQDFPEKRHLRKEIAKELMSRFRERKKSFGFIS